MHVRVQDYKPGWFGLADLFQIQEKCSELQNLVKKNVVLFLKRTCHLCSYCASALSVWTAPPITDKPIHFLSH